ncbi:C-reactive protein-like [Clinocottus analis]|uniref:C-reactive protein-like n=1 Tax=Clinocottus analis TaxID=304258 RepID=UPI0035C25DC0
MRLSAILLLVSALVGGSVAMRTLVFPQETSTSYVEMIPQKPLSLKAFTLCFRVATELKGEREVILFAYRTPDFDELNVWRELDGRLSLYMSGDGVFFDVPHINALETHICITWDSASGAATVYIDGKKSVTKIYRKNHVVRPGGKVIIGQDPDNFVGNFEPNQSLVGEISDINMWDILLWPDNVQELFDRKRVVPGKIFNWDTAELQIHGDVHVIDNEL